MFPRWKASKTDFPQQGPPYPGLCFDIRPPCDWRTGCPKGERPSDSLRQVVLENGDVCGCRSGLIGGIWWPSGDCR